MIHFLIKGLIRDRSRSLFPILMVSSGVFLTVLYYCTMQGLISDMADSNARFEAGHLKVMTRGYSELSDQMPNDMALLNVGNLIIELKKDYPDIIWTPRIKFGGLLDIPDEEGITRSQVPVFGMGINLIEAKSPEISILNLEKAIVQGSLPRARNDILISDDLAKSLNVSIGDSATLIGSTMYGSMSMHNFRIAGTVRFGMTIVDRSAIIADINDVRDALDINDGASEIVGFSKNMIYEDNIMKNVAMDLNRKFINSYSNENSEFSPVIISLGEQGIFGYLLKIIDAIVGGFILFFVFAMSLVLWNSGLMNGIRRYGEVGIRLAMGEPKGDIYRSMIIESLCIGIAGSVLGTAFGLMLSYWLQNVGYDFGSMTQKYTVIMSTVFRARVDTFSYIIGFLPGVFASVIGTMFAGIGIYRRQTSQLFRELEV
jgi:putative ABC transport system permease protein